MVVVVAEVVVVVIIAEVAAVSTWTLKTCHITQEAMCHEMEDHQKGSHNAIIIHHSLQLVCQAWH